MVDVSYQVVVDADVVSTVLSVIPKWQWHIRYRCTKFIATQLPTQAVLWRQWHYSSAFVSNKLYNIPNKLNCYHSVDYCRPKAGRGSMYCRGISRCRNDTIFWCAWVTRTFMCYDYKSWHVNMTFMDRYVTAVHKSVSPNFPYSYIWQYTQHPVSMNHVGYIRTDLPRWEQRLAGLLRLQAYACLCRSATIPLSSSESVMTNSNHRDWRRGTVRTVLCSGDRW